LRAASGAFTTTSTMVGVSRSTLCTVASSCVARAAKNEAAEAGLVGARLASTRDTTGKPWRAEPSALTTLPK